MYIVAGLGNPGKKFKNTRHNTGFYMVEKIAGEKGWRKNKKGNCLYKKKQTGGENTLFVKPQTFMNNSGVCIRFLKDNFKVKPQNIIIIHDDADLKLGQVKISKGRGAAGHNGVGSIIEKLSGNDFVRIRVGIKTPEAEKEELKKFVLQRLKTSERKKIENTVSVVKKGLMLIIKEGLGQAMTEVNGLK